MSITQPEFLKFIRRLFKKHGCDYDQIQAEFYKKFNSDSEKRDCLPVLAHFYYFICTPEKKAREELQIVGMTSLIEAMMSEVEFKDVFQYFESEFRGQNKIEDFSEFKKGYLEKYGATKGIMKYFQNYIPKDESDKVLKSISRINRTTGDMVPFTKLDQLAKFLYQMRSDFVHAADMQSLCPDHCFAALISVGGKAYDVRIGIPSILDIFEKSFVLFWKEKYDSLNTKQL